MKQYPDIPLLDQDGLHRVPLRFYAVLLLLLRPYLCWLVTLVMPEAERKAVLSFFYPLADDFVRAVLIAIPALLVLAAVSQRVPYDKKQRRGRAKKFWFALWRYGLWLLLAVASVDLYWTISHLPPYVALNAPGLLLIVAALGLSVLYLLRSKQLRLIFTEWPEDKK
ncbi:DUF2919 family protein [Rheinheimera sp.]|uniref:DUF2919 family protein n=1 Tax=Rheinheimera sp. TaxID=1869214 RepID=UPI003D2BAF85